VVRLTEPRHVEIHAPGAEVHRAWPGERLRAPGVLKNPVLVEALYSRTAAQRMTLDNLLQREGYDGLDAIRAEVRALAEACEQAERALAEACEQAERALVETSARALAEGRAAVRDLCEVLDIALTPERDAALSAMDEPGLYALRARLKARSTLGLSDRREAPGARLPQATAQPLTRRTGAQSRRRQTWRTRRLPE
jgi:hypothetical protein